MSGIWIQRWRRIRRGNDLVYGCFFDTEDDVGIECSRFDDGCTSLEIVM